MATSCSFFFFKQKTAYEISKLASPAGEVEATRKAALWSAIAGVAQLGIVAFGGLAYPIYDVLVAVGYGFLLPGVAVLHVRPAAGRQSGTILATIAGAAGATLGPAGSANPDGRPAARFGLGLW